MFPKATKQFIFVTLFVYVVTFTLVTINSDILCAMYLSGILVSLICTTYTIGITIREILENRKEIFTFNKDRFNKYKAITLLVYIISSIGILMIAILLFNGFMNCYIYPPKPCDKVLLAI